MRLNTKVTHVRLPPQGSPSVTVVDANGVTQDLRADAVLVCGGPLSLTPIPVNDAF